jgi:hypothetical protein
MQYEGELYGKVGRKYLRLNPTSTDVDNLLRASKEMLHRATEGQPKGYADGEIGLTDHQSAAIWLKGAIRQFENSRITHRSQSD